MGLLSYEDTTSNSGLRCISYSVKQTEAFDEYFRAARTCALGGIVLIGISAMLLCIISCVVVKPLVITCISAALILGGILEGCTFLIFLSEFSCKDCQFYFGAALSLLCTAVTIINGILVWHMQEDAENNFDENAENTESSDKKKRKRPSTPRIVSSSNTSSSDDIIIPERLTAYDKEVVLVLPDGRKQIIEPTISNACCGTGFNIFPSCTS